MKCLYSQEDIIKFSEGVLCTEDADRIKMHIKSCEKCSWFYEQIVISERFDLNNNDMNSNIHDKISYVKSRHLVYKVIPFKKFILSVAVIVIIAISLTLYNQRLNDSNLLYTESLSQSPDDINKIANQKTLKLDQADINESPIQSLIPLEFESIDIGQEIPTIDQETIKNVIKKYETDDVALFTFKKTPDDFNVYLAISANNLLYEVGQVGYGDLDIHIESTFLYNKSLICAKGAVGSISPVTYYIYMEDYTPKILLNLNRSVKEVDIDADGISEVIAQTGRMVEIYKLVDNEMTYASLNKVLNAEQVFYLEEELAFVAYSSPSSEFPKYKLTSKGFLPLN